MDKWGDTRPKWSILVWLPAVIADKFKTTVRKGMRTAFIVEAIEEKLAHLEKKELNDDRHLRDS